MNQYTDNFCPSDERFVKLLARYSLENFWIFVSYAN